MTVVPALRKVSKLDMTILPVIDYIPMSIVDQKSYSENAYSDELANDPWSVFFLFRCL
jgi:hypothetical protein